MILLKELLIQKEYISEFFLQDKEENRDILKDIPNCKVLFCNYEDTFGPVGLEIKYVKNYLMMKIIFYK